MDAPLPQLLHRSQDSVAQGRLDLSSLPKATEAELSSLPYLLDTTNVTELVLLGMTNLTDVVLNSLSTSFPALQSLSLKYSRSVSNYGLLAFAGGCPNLTTVDLTGCVRVSDTGVSALARACTRLQSLNVSFCSNLTDASLCTLAAVCPRLAVLNLGYCDVTDTTLFALARACQWLQDLSLTFCKKVTDEGVRAVLAGCPMLTSLALRSTCVTDVTAFELARVREWRLLDLSCLTTLTDASIIHLHKHSTVHSITLSGCTKLTRKSKRLFAARK
mmetsp:Transcript_25844/g.64932  ORF Transcript_25844/g.64932 Transcript_25844/m.64932 type:complete len:274 (+) Transcript_25844:122-943(+)|eukprot:CAMPEP_0177643364 /NCGR_PEP_ID=MMETSP0447-20121125/8116_1 /TAXON_ID=0 /ORGANISM="Stygamoeba regulata, Strain BSH-02190019" /LENGTH=273 /DNA_ID=CAMNT_0019145655 /DNA_START=33 /DNA_END=854 /DNA_ORIENTATION=+